LHDALTGLPNRRSFYERVSSGLQAVSGETEPPLSIAIVDLDNFKRVNDTHGHVAGDAVLQAIASGLQAVTRPSDSSRASVVTRSLSSPVEPTRPPPARLEFVA
jgi:diguanylate cyclase (GGDEF)-like protein